MSSAALEYRILGPLHVADAAGTPVDVTAAKQRALLVRLLVDANEVVAADALVDALWGEAAPASSAKLLQVYVSQLRRTLGNGVVETRAPGYALRVDPGRVDASRFEQLTTEGRATLADGNAERAARLLRRALDLWRGPALADVAYADFARGEAERLEELKLVCLEERIAADVELGRHEEVLAELTALVGEHPLRERLRYHLMLALYRAGRQADALAAYREGRRVLREEVGLDPSPELRELERAILRQDAALAAPEAPPRTSERVPLPLTQLVGRAGEVSELRALLAEPHARLITLVGAAGSGKTRLAVAVADACRHDFANGAVFVELGALDDAALVLPTVAHALGVTDTGAQLPETLAEALAPRELLLVLDTFEHVVGAAADVVALVAACPLVRLVVTSRRVLHVSGEQVYPVRPLAEADAAELFRRRARAVGAAVDVADEETIRAICRRVDGLPLALELAAARTATLTPRELLGRLSARLTVLTGGPRDLPARQQTLRETLDWSAGLLDEHEQRAFARLGVFVGSWTLEAAEAVCDADLDTVTSLVGHSLVHRAESEGGARFAFLDTIREYALERLAAFGDDGLVLGRHADWYAELAEAAEPELSGDRQTEWFSRLDAEHDNLRAANAHLRAAGEGERALALTIALTRFRYVRGYLSEARRSLEDALAGAGDVPLQLRRRALTAAGAVALLQGDYDAATRLADESLAVARETGEPLYVANALSNLGAITLAAGDRARSGAALEEAVPLAREAGDSRILALALNNLGDHALTVGDYERAGPLFEESLALLRERGDTANIARSLFNVGAVALMRARRDEARERFAESLALCDAAGDREDLAWCLEGFAALAATAADAERAALLLGAATTILDEMGAALKPFERQLHEGTEATARAALGPAAFDATVARGAALGLAAARELALSGP